MLQTEFSNWDLRFFQLATLVSSWSEDNSRKIGAVITGNSNEVISVGYNGLPRGVDSSIPARHRKTDGEKYLWFEHAERNAIYNAARSGNSLSDRTIYSTMYPCADCQRAIIQSGISTLKTFSPPEFDQSFGRSFNVASIMASEAGLNVQLFDADQFSAIVLQSKE